MELCLKTGLFILGVLICAAFGWFSSHSFAGASSCALYFVLYFAVLQWISHRRAKRSFGLTKRRADVE